MKKNQRILSILIIVLIYLIGDGSSAKNPGEFKWVNLAHLNHLYESITIDGREMAIIHIYADYPDYAWVDAAGEGIACVDDAARAVVVYLRHFELSGDISSLERAKKLLEFCRYMQANDGLFYNFIFADPKINKDGKTSYKSFGCWTARSVWARMTTETPFHYTIGGPVGNECTWEAGATA